MRRKKVVLNRQETAWEEWVSSTQMVGRKNEDHPVDFKDPSDSSMQEAVSRLAYSYWEARGFQDGSAEEDWLRAEAEIQLPGIRSRTNGDAKLAQPTLV